MNLFNETVSKENHRISWAAHFLSQVSLSKEPGLARDSQMMASSKE